MVSKLADFKSMNFQSRQISISRKSSLRGSAVSAFRVSGSGGRHGISGLPHCGGFLSGLPGLCAVPTACSPDVAEGASFQGLAPLAIAKVVSPSSGNGSAGDSHVETVEKGQI